MHWSLIKTFIIHILQQFISSLLCLGLLLLDSLQLCLNLLVLLNQLVQLVCWKDLDLGHSILPGQLNLLWSQLGHDQGLQRT